MDPISSQQFSATAGDQGSQRIRRLLQSAALAALAIGFAAALPVSLDSPFTLSKAFADGGEGGEGGGGEGGWRGGGGEGGDHDGDHDGGEHGGDDHEAATVARAATTAAPAKAATTITKPAMTSR